MIVIIIHSRYVSSCHYHQINLSITYLYVLGFKLTVEKSDQRIFKDEEYAR